MNNNKQKQTNKQNKQNKQNKNNNSIVIVQKLNSIYPKLKEQIECRYKLQLQQDKLWREVKNGHKRKAELTNVTNKIGQSTHMINVYIGQLSKLKYNHKAMNIACDYLDKEIARCGKIIGKWNKNIYDVSRGYANFISSNGYVHSSTSGASAYVHQKQQQITKLKDWKQQLSRYRV